MSEKNLSSISDSEWEVMRIVWTLGETNTKQILNELQAKKDWTDSTIKTLIRRLVQKGWLNAKQDGCRYIYTATVNQTDMMYNEAKTLLNRMCDMHKGEVILKLLEDSPVSKDDLMKMKKEISQKEKTAPEMVPCNCLKTGSTIC
ncbi:CopY/TcrY family copper transport repressor [Lactobacillus johnsonii]|uniref:CopY/TcrY family copper transport repressor n=1 Tax=Lactobacillus johnsonii TaxID=33959 RepID=UPI003F51405E